MYTVTNRLIYCYCMDTVIEYGTGIWILQCFALYYISTMVAWTAIERTRRQEKSTKRHHTRLPYI